MTHARPRTPATIRAEIEEWIEVHRTAKGFHLHQLAGEEIGELRDELSALTGQPRDADGYANWYDHP